MGENNHRIKSYMADLPYSEEVTYQEEYIDQVYKDYLLDYRFEKEEIFVSAEINKALAEVSYQMTYVSEVNGNQ